MESLISLVISLGSCVCCCLFWVAVIAGIYFLVFKKRGDDDGTDLIDEKPDIPDVEPKKEPARPEEDPTVVAPSVVAGAQKPQPPSAPPPPPPAAPPAPPAPKEVAKPPAPPPPEAPKEPAPEEKVTPTAPPRTSGATIIAFDDDEDDF